MWYPVHDKCRFSCWLTRKKNDSKASVERLIAQEQQRKDLGMRSHAHQLVRQWMKVTRLLTTAFQSNALEISAYSVDNVEYLLWSYKQAS